MPGKASERRVVAAAALFGVYACLLLSEAVYVGWMSGSSTDGRTWAGPEPIQHARTLVAGAAAFVALAWALARRVRMARLVGITVSSLLGCGSLVLLASMIAGAGGLPSQVLGQGGAATLAAVTSVVLLAALALLLHVRPSGAAATDSDLAYDDARRRTSGSG
jgi:hypothetical protein